MSCFSYVKLHDNNASCTGNPDQCWIVPDGQVAAADQHVDPVALGWTLDRDCAGFNAASTPCTSCGSSTPTNPTTPTPPTTEQGGQTVTPSKSSVLRKTDAGYFELATAYGGSADTLLYRLYKQTQSGATTVLDAQPLWTAQGRGGERTFVIDYVFQPSQAYGVIVQRVGESRAYTEYNIVGVFPADPTSVVIDADTADFEASGATTLPPNSSGDGFDTSYVNPDAGGKDFNNTPFVTQTVPSVVLQQKSKPRQLAGRIVMAIQTALNTLVTRRFKPFTLPFSWDGTTLTGWMVPYSGPDFTGQRTDIMARGFNTIAESTPNRVSYGSGIGYYNVSGGYPDAKAAADRLPPGDYRKAILLKWWNNDQGGGESVIDPSAAELLGIEIYNQRQNADWTSATGGAYVALTLNFEVSVAPAGSGQSEEDARMNMIGLVMRGIRKRALEKGHTPPLLVCYDHSGLAFINPQLISRDLPASSGVYDDFNNIAYSNAIAGLPAYFEGAFLNISVKGGSGNTPLTANNEMVKYALEFGAVMGSQEYMQSTYPDESLWQKSNGQFVTRVAKDKAGKDVQLLVARIDARDVVIQGETCSLIPPGHFSDGEAQNFLQDWYRLAHMGPVEYTARAGRVHYAKSNVRQAGWEKVWLGHWTRGDAEFKTPSRILNTNGVGYQVNPVSGKPYDQELDKLNSRPLNLDFAEFDLIHNLVCCLRSLYRVWNGPQPVIAELGKSLAGTAFAGYGNHARAIYETYQKAMERANQFAWVTANVMQPLFGELAVRNFARDRSWHDVYGEFEKKALVNALICEQRADRNNTPWMVLAGTFPAMDPGITTPLTVWCLNDNGTADGPAYSIDMGRTIGIDDFQITASQASKPPKNWRYRYVDMLGETRVRCFDYREANPTVNLTPPAAA